MHRLALYMPLIDFFCRNSTHKGLAGLIKARIACEVTPKRYPSSCSDGCGADCSTRSRRTRGLRPLKQSRQHIDETIWRTRTQQGSFHSCLLETKFRLDGGQGRGLRVQPLPGNRPSSRAFNGRRRSSNPGFPLYAWQSQVPIAHCSSDCRLRGDDLRSRESRLHEHAENPAKVAGAPYVLLDRGNKVWPIRATMLA